MSADALRRAAALMRSRAERVLGEEVWPRRDIHRVGTCDGCAQGGTRLVAAYDDPAGASEPWLCVDCADEADYIAAMGSKGFALAVADLLDRAAADHDETPCPAIDAALAVARAYLGESA